MRGRAWLLVAASAVLSAGARADVLNVGGPAPDFAQIADAVAAATNGDLIRVWPGTYGPFTVRDRSLSIARATFTGEVQVAGTIHVQDLSAGRSLVLTGISSEGIGDAGLVILDCEGSVRVREGRFLGARNAQPGTTTRPPGARVERCQDVAFVYCIAQGGEPLPNDYYSSGGHGLVALDSQVALFTSTFVGARGTSGDSAGSDGFDGGHGVRTTGPGVLYASRCTMRGGRGGDANYDCFFFCGWGGNGGWAHSGTTPAWMRDCVLEPGAGGWSPDSSKLGQPGSSTPALTTLLPGPARVLRTSWLLTDTSALSVRCEGAPGESVWLAESPQATWQLPEPEAGPILIAPAPPPLATRWRFLGVVGPSGLLLVDLPARDLPHLTHQTLHYQALFIAPATRVLSSPSWSMHLDAAW